MPFVASGAFGCVFKPHLKCKKTSNKPAKKYPKAIGKVFENDEDFETEHAITSMMQRLDKENKFTLPLLDTCDTNSRVRKSDDVEQCMLIDMNIRNEYKQIIMRYGGKSIDNFMFNKTLTYNRFINLLKLLEPILEGLVLLDKHGIVHQDIKPENIMYIHNRLYLIDFGLLTNYPSLFSKENRIIHADYIYFPPEFKIYGKKYANAKEFISFVSDSLNMSPRVAGRSINFITEAYQVIDMDIEEELETFYKQYNKSKSKAKDLLSFCRRIDIYQIGIVVFLAFLATKDNLALFEAKRSSKKTLVKQEVVTFIKSIMCPNPYKRPTAQEALKEYKKMIALL
jgi:serine/threonine protein kinase